MSTTGTFSAQAYATASASIVPLLHIPQRNAQENKSPYHSSTLTPTTLQAQSSRESATRRVVHWPGLFPRRADRRSRRSQSSSYPMDCCTELQRITQSVCPAQHCSSRSDTPPKELALRTALPDSRPTKKRATNAIKMAEDVVRKHTELKRKERVSEVIEISSDSEPEIWPSKVRHAFRLPGQPYTSYLRGKKSMIMLDHYHMTRMLDPATPTTYQNWRPNSPVLSSILRARPIIGVIQRLTTMTA